MVGPGCEPISVVPQCHLLPQRGVVLNLVDQPQETHEGSHLTRISGQNIQTGGPCRAGQGRAAPLLGSSAYGYCQSLSEGDRCPLLLQGASVAEGLTVHESIRTVHRVDHGLPLFQKDLPLEAYSSEPGCSRFQASPQLPKATEILKLENFL